MSVADRMARFLFLFYMVAFFVYLFAPLAIMGAATFNTSRFPTVTPWQGTTLQWFVDGVAVPGANAASFVFQQDGAIRVAVGATGINEVKMVAESDATTEEDLADFLDVAQYATMMAPSYTIQGGTTQVLRGIVARGLGLR